MSDQSWPAPGRFVWHDLMTTDLEKALPFYTDLFGWTIKPIDMGEHGTYNMFAAGGVDQGGLVTLRPDDGHPSHWIAYVLVDDVDAAARRATGLGGEVPMPGMDIPDVGRFAVVVSPTGAVISPFRPLTPGPDTDPPAQQGTVVWHELLALDPEREGAFHREIFGWGAGSADMGPMGTYHLFKRDGKDVAGMLQKPDGSGPSTWLPYVAVEDVDDRAERVKALGGTVHVAPQDIPGIGRFAVASDPTGALFALYRAAA